MKVLLSEHRAAPVGGAERSLLELATALRQKQHVLDLAYQGAGEFLLRYGELCESTLKVPLIRLPTSSRRLLLSLLRSAWTAAGARPDVVHVNMSFDVIFGAFTALMAGAPLTCHLRGWPPATFEVLDRAAWARVTRFIAVSDYVKRSWVRAGLDPNRVAIVHIGVDPSHYRPPADEARSSTRAELGLGTEDLLVLYAGRISPEKGIETLLEAFQLLSLPARRVQLRLVCCPVVSGKQAYARELQAKPGPWIWGKSRTDMLPLYGAADLVVVPSTGPESFARVPLEAMACGCPVVASRIGGLPEQLTGSLSRLLVPPGDAAGLAAKLEWALGWREHSPSLGRRCREHVATRFNLDRSAAGVEKVLREAIDEHLRSRSDPLGKRLVGWRRRSSAIGAPSPAASAG